MLTAFLVRAQELFAQVVVDRRIRAAPGGGREGDGRRSGPAAADEELRAGAAKGTLGRAHAEAEAGREELPQGAVEGGRIMCGGCIDGHLASEDGLLELAAPYPVAC